MLRSLRFHWRLSLALAAGAAAASTVLTGALVVGDSVRGSLRALALDRLGAIDGAILSSRWFPESLAARLPPDGSPALAVPITLARGSAVQPESRSRASGIQILGVPPEFALLFPGTGERLAPLHPQTPASPLPPILVNAALARALGAAAGDPILLTAPRPQEAPPDTLLGRRDEESLVASLRGRIAAVVEDSAAGGFTVSPHQAIPLNAFVPLADLQRAMGTPGRVNSVLIEPRAPGQPVDWDSRVRAEARLEDFSISLLEEDGRLIVESRQFVLAPEVSSLIAEQARALGATPQPVQTYLATALRARGGSVPYSTISALDPVVPGLPWLTLETGAPAPPLEAGEIYLNAWAASRLGAAAGETVEVDYFVIADDESLITRTAEFRLAGIVAMSGLAVDRGLTPEYPGIARARDIASWDPPFPVDLSRIARQDEDYWDTWGAAPKAFIAPREAASLWANRYGTHTSIRLAPPEGVPATEMQPRLASALCATLPLAPFGMNVRAIRAEALAAGSGATDFSGLFLGFSLFLILSSCLLCALLARLSVETRAREVGLLLAVGWPARRVLRRFLSEGMLLTTAGVAVGLAGGVLYARLLLAGLRTLWQPAVGTRALELHLSPSTLPLSAAASLLVVGISILLALRRLQRAQASSLLGGAWPQRLAAAGRGASWLRPLALLAAALSMTAAAFIPSATAPAALAFGAGAFLLAASVTGFSTWLRAAGRSSRTPSRLSALAARNTGWNPARALLSVALMGSAAFVILTVAASRRAGEIDEGLAGGSGGYDLVATSEIALHQDLSTKGGRSEAGLDDSLSRSLEGAVVTSFRSVPGDDVSCLNLYRATRPRLLGVPASQIERGGFAFAGTLRKADNPWRLLDEPLEPGVIPAIGDQNSVLWILHSGLGGEIEIQDESGRPLRLRFVALLSGSLFQSEVLVPESALLEHFPSRSGRDWFLLDTAEGAREAIARGLEEALAPRGFDVQTASDRIASFHSVENTYLSTFLLLGGLGLLLGTAGLGISVARNVLERRGELAGMRAFGWPRGRLARLVLLENAVLLAVGLGAGALAAGLAVAPRLAAGQVHPPGAPILLTLGAVAAAGMLSGAVAVRSALRAPLIPSLRSER